MAELLKFDVGTGYWGSSNAIHHIIQGFSPMDALFIVWLF